MSDPAESFDIAVDESNDREARTDAIDELESANECGKLAEIVQRDDLADEYREEAVIKMASPQCKDTLETLLDSGDLPESLAKRAETMLQDTPDHPGGGQH